MANWRFVARDRNYAVGRLALYQPAAGEPSPWSDLRVVLDAVDGEGNNLGDLVVAQRDILPLPDGQAAIFVGDVLAPYTDPGFDTAALNGFVVYGHIVDSFDAPTNFALTKGYHVEVTHVPARPGPGVPNVGDVVVAFPGHFYLERDGYAFVRVARALNSGPEYGYYAKAVML